MSSINKDMGVSCLVITGAGKSFSSGGNVKEMRDRTGLFGGNPAEVPAGQSGVMGLLRVRKP